MKNTDTNQDLNNKNEKVFEKIDGHESFNNTNRSQDGTSREKKIIEANDVTTDKEETSTDAEGLITTERSPNNSSIFGNICGTSQDKTAKEKGLVQNLSNYFKSDDLKTILKFVSLDKANREKFTGKLKEYLERYENDTINLYKLKIKFNNYIKECKSHNKDNILKNKEVGNKIDQIKTAIFTYIDEKERLITNELDETHTFGGGLNSPRDNENNNDKSFLDIPALDMSAINNDENLFTNTQTIDQNQTFRNSSNSNRSENGSNKNNAIEKMGDDSLNLDLSNIAPNLTSSEAVDITRFEIMTFIKIFESTFGYKISPSTEKFIVDLVLETEEYIKNIAKLSKNYEIKEYIKNKISEAIAKSTSKEGVEKNISELEGTEDFKMELSQKQDEEVKDSYLAKLLSKANKIYEKAYNKYYGYNNLSEKEIVKIAEYAYKRHNESEEEKLKRNIYNDQEDIKSMEEFVKTKGFTVENCDSKDFHEISHQGHQSLTVQPLDDDDVTAYTTPGYCDLNCYTVAAASALVYAMSYMLAFDNEVSHTGFGPSGF